MIIQMLSSQITVVFLYLYLMDLKDEQEYVIEEIKKIPSIVKKCVE